MNGVDIDDEHPMYCHGWWQAIEQQQKHSNIIMYGFIAAKPLRVTI